MSANNPQTNPARTNNQRQELAGRTASSQSAGSESERSMPGSLSDTARSETTGSGQDPELARLNLIVQVDAATRHESTSADIMHSTSFLRQL